jgi:hypothetical protein
MTLQKKTLLHMVRRAHSSCAPNNIPTFPGNLLSESCGEIGFKSRNQVLTWKLGHKVPLLSFSPTCFLQAMLLGDLVGVLQPM